uniref:Uncharacterized protein n=1 Tax=Angiostrongylus cantonensis TaxID=6313 RepID=A0A0K0DP42_ANGCA
LVSDNTKTNKDHTGEHHHVGLWTLNRERLMLLRLSAILLTIYFIYFIEFVAYYRQKQQGFDLNSKTTAESQIVLTYHWENRLQFEWV